MQAAADVKAGDTLISLPSKCHLTYDGSTDARLMALIDQVPAELWGAKLALQASAFFGSAQGRCSNCDSFSLDGKWGSARLQLLQAPCCIAQQRHAQRCVGGVVQRASL